MPRKPAFARDGDGALLGLDPRPEPRLVEMAWGEWEGRRLADLRAELGDAMIENEARGLDFRPPGGESPRDVQERLKPLLACLSAPDRLRYPQRRPACPLCACDRVEHD